VCSLTYDLDDFCQQNSVSNVYGQVLDESRAARLGQVVVGPVCINLQHRGQYGVRVASITVDKEKGERERGRPMEAGRIFSFISKRETETERDIQRARKAEREERERPRKKEREREIETERERKREIERERDRQRGRQK
jgi:hypothetical protein